MAKKGWPKLEEGVNYRIRYKLQSGNYRWYEWEMTAKYVGQGRSKLLFSLRPYAGTQDFDEDQILSIWEMPRTTEAKLPRRIGPHKEASHT